MGALGGLDSTSTAHICFSASFLHMCYTVLCLCPGARINICPPDKSCPACTSPLLQPHLVLTNNSWLASRLPSCRCLRHTHLLPYLLGFHIWGVVMNNSCLSGLASSKQLMHTSHCVVLQFQSWHQPSKIRPKNYSLHSKYLKDIQ